MRAPCIALAFVLSACASSQPATGVVVRISAEPGLQADIARIVTRIFGSDGRGDDTGGVVVSTTSDIQLTPGTRQLPYTIGIAPNDWDASRIYRLEVDAYDASGTMIASAKIISGYRPAAVLEVQLLFEDLCRGVLCSAINQTCRRAMCVDAHVDQTTLPVHGSDASVTVDASIDDAGDTGDAGHDSGVQSCGVGYTSDGTGGCVDIDECATNNGGCSNSPMVTCTNVPGSWSCEPCPAGYSGDGVTCTPIDCGTPASVTNGTYAVSGGLSGGTSTTYGATAAYACQAGFAKSGADTTCEASGSWSLPAPTCTAIAAFCPAAPAIANETAGSPTVSGGVGGGSTTSLGATASYTCSAGYNRVGANPTCQSNGTWSAAPSCTAIAAYCPALSAPSNGSVGVSGGAAGGSTTSLNATASYACSGGYAVSGSASRTCGSAGTWSGAAPSCVDANECALGTSNCDTSPAACVNTVGGYTCTCPVSYTGTGVGSSGCLYNVSTLSNLTVASATLAPAFLATELVYTVQVPAGGGSFTFTPTVAVPSGQTIRVNGVVHTSGTARLVTAPADALTPVITTVTVTAATGLVSTYTLIATKSHFLVGTTSGGDNYVPEVAVSGDGLRLALADQRDGTLGQYSRGAVFLYRNVGGIWSYETVFRASDGIGQDEFGTSVALSNDGTTVAVGAKGKDNGATYDVGGVYVYQNTSGTWGQQTILVNPDPDANDNMGQSVDISSDGNVIATGVTGEDSASTGIGGSQTSTAATDSGAVYVFTRSGTVWSAATYIKASNTGTGDVFGTALSLGADGNTLVVGAPNEDGSATGIGGTSNELAVDAGAVYTYLRSGGTWSFYRYVKASNTGGGDHFGWNNAVSLSDDGLRLVVGAPDEDSSSTGANGVQANETATGAGAAYVFTRTVSTPWVQNAYLKASNTNANDRFGASATIAGNGTRIAIGAIGEASALQSTPADNTMAGAGAVYVFLYTGFTQATYLKATSAIASTEFGFGLSYSSTGTVFGVATHNRCDGGGVATVDVVSRTDNSRNAAWGNQGAVYLY